MSDSFQDALAGLAAIVGDKHVIASGADQEPYVVDWRGRYRGRAVAVVKPGSTAEVASVVRYCADRRLAIVPQGGNTGMCGAATPDDHAGNVVIRLDRMRAVRDVSPLANTITVEAGCILAEVQNAARDVDRYFPLSLGAEGSCQIGGNISTNAGGTAVLRYGPTRDLVLGLEAVLPDGRIFNGLRALRKDNTGYALKQLFIGAEGTLGIVTAAVLKLFSPPRSSALALVKLQGVAQALEIMQRLRGVVGDRLGSLEIMSRSQIEVIAETVPHVTIPFELTTPWYLIVELTDTLAGVDLDEPLATALADAMEAGIAEDVILASNLAQVKAIWAVRHSVSEGNKRSGYVVSHDSVVPLERQADFVTNVETRIMAAVPHARVVMHGHIGDGNIHVIALIDRAHCQEPATTAALVAQINEIVDDETAAQGGAISAEHGIGITNRVRLARVADPLDIELMRGIKRLLDPSGLMNPGKIFGAGAA
ncbi:FAD-dependent oxidoreductase [Bradyrhizobium japonicum]|uniref:FAD-dependent oxidoreductase n=1 Tax=Bradyrhizobium japonicum TaxID=375 RepID=A0A0A3XTD6_BRAJP|nr:FAD-binding oxidoreductase [Bradyrhizobium japonicum]KGT76421.1 FAD-dependent oxidoreductase [Bradyrhizobium japonicum]MCS3897096.1 FAD/FMN-containing dehydrogenase [Bradyrhizobium japonicum USDA 38]MCS3949611.1 FAD/FMN-containing dehydrogenase [Bradyrhizobium japonicum]MCW2217701.1 FAD/FMN-containing dehydrogenase [Bradyrhizobium japonicum]MCW2342316.1 FAD/FMN-containing dehydrogenase [Bradyrhizobium japonicum]